VAPVVAAAGVTAFGCSAAALGLGLADPAAAPPLAYPALWPPLWVFWAVWLVIYPASGVAAWLIWRERRRADVRGALVAFALLNTSAALFLPISALVGGAPAVLTLMDLNGVVTVAALAWLFSRYSTTAAWWLAPYLVWMPITTALKVWLWTLN
jgi:tryptophan-rich sensory protein